MSVNYRRGALVIVLAALLLGGCLGKKSAIPRYSASSLHADYMAEKKHVTDLDGRVVNISGTVTRLDQSLMRSVYLVLDGNIVVYIRKDQVHKLGEIGVGVGDHITCTGVFGGRSVVSKYTTASEGDVLVLDNAEVIGVSESWIPELPLLD